MTRSSESVKTQSEKPADILERMAEENRRMAEELSELVARLRAEEGQDDD